MNEWHLLKGCGARNITTQSSIAERQRKNDTTPWTSVPPCGVWGRYDYMEVIGRVESGTETESDAGTLTGRKWLKTSGTGFPAKAEKLLFY